MIGPSVSRLRPDDPDEVGVRMFEIERAVRGLQGKAGSGRVGGPIVLETARNVDGTYTVILRNEVTGNVVTLADAL